MFLVDAKSPTITVEVIPTIARDKQCWVNFDKVRAARNNVLGKVGRGCNIVDFSLVKERIQFDRPIGSFQAVQHRMVDRFIDIEGLPYLVYEAAREISIGSPTSLHISMAKAKANEVCQRTCIECIRNHGAIGFTADHDIGLYYRRVKAAEFFLADTDFHREKVAIKLGL